jgi:glycosyltransferase involved in cell wall biosynthesis
LAQACGIPEGKIIYTDQYAYRMGLKPEMLAAMYSAFDVLLSPSMGEGFGIPVVEAQACGVPVIVSDATAQPELVGSGWAVGGVPDWDEAQGSWLHLPDVFEIAASLDEAYEGGGDREEARRFALGYDHRLVYNDYWRPVLAELGRTVEVGDGLDIGPI